jgi:hypothetical protein
MVTLDMSRLQQISSSQSRFSRQLARLRAAGIDTRHIETTTSSAVENVRDGDCTSFVIYGDPQSGKTEMMICLTARLLDDGYRLIIHLLNDSVQLLGQNLGRFQRSGLAPAAKNFSEILDPEINLRKGEWVVFCKKNASDLQKLLDKTRTIPDKVVIDDEADFATPNAKINIGEITKINGLIGGILGSTGTYIGVTATPARLDLNNTFENDNEKWVRFPPHDLYTGQDEFFPLDRKVGYKLTLLPDEGDSPRYIKEALHRFIVNVAYLNTKKSGGEKNYSMLVHTSGKREDHKVDKKIVEAVFQSCSEPTTSEYKRTMEALFAYARERFPDASPQRLVEYVAQNASRNTIVVMNSERDKNVDLRMATTPATPFTVVIGGNIKNLRNDA